MFYFFSLYNFNLFLTTCDVGELNLQHMFFEAHYLYYSFNFFEFYSMAFVYFYSHRAYIVFWFLNTCANSKIVNSSYVIVC